MESSDVKRLDRVETEVGAIRSEMGHLTKEVTDVRSDVKSLGGILTRIEQGIGHAQEQQEEREAQRRHSPVALATVLVTIMSMLIGGAWVIGSTTSRTAVRLDDQDVQLGRLLQMRDRELDTINHRLDRIEDRGVHAEPGQARE